MLSLTDPSELEPQEAYRQAQLVAAKTSRGRDRNWYRTAVELPFQWHLWFDGGRDVISATFTRQDSKWRLGPHLPLSTLTTGEGLDSILESLTKEAFFGRRPNSLGVVFHVADEFVLAELDEENVHVSDESENFEMLQYRLIDDPRGVLMDHEVNDETTSWRLLPFWGASAGHSRCTSIALSRSREAFLKKLVFFGETSRFPIRVAVTSAPIESLAALPLIEPNLIGCHLIVFIYAKFSAVFALNSSGELRRARSLSHRPGAVTPNGLGEILWGMAVSQELVGRAESIAASPVKVLLMSSQADTLNAATRDLESEPLLQGRLVWETRNFGINPYLLDVPGLRPEYLVHDSIAIERAKSANGALTQTETFNGLWKQWGAQSNYFDITKLDNLYPTLANLRLLRLSSFIVFSLTLFLIGVLGYGGYSYWTATQHPSWTLTQPAIKQSEDQLAKLQIEKRQITITDNLLKPRSKGWVILELILRAFPEDTEVQLENFSYQMDSAPPQTVAAKGKEVPNLGYTRVWTLKGLAKESGLERLASLNGQSGLGKLFDQMVEATGDTSYSQLPSRQLKIALTLGRNPKFSNQGPTDLVQETAAGFAYSFDATITQTVTDKDPLALPTPKPF
jgi:hypothetical protein